MSNNKIFLLKYFFMCGVEKKIKDILKINAFKEDNTINPVLLSSYSAEGKTESFEAIKEKINKDKYLKYNIFPKIADYLSDFVFPEDLDSPKLQLKSNPFNQYIKAMKSFDQVPEHFFHCFQYAFQIKEDREDIYLNFSVLLFYENSTDERDLYKENQERSWYNSFLYSQYYHTFTPKAIILVSEKPIFSFMKEILEFLYKNYIKKKYTYFPIEHIIINIFQKINNDNFEENLDIKMKYRLYKEPIIPYCDLNISFFLKIFDLEDILLIAEYYFCAKTIILACTKVEYLFPIYYIFMSLFFPLNINSKERFYKLLVPDQEILERILFAKFATFTFIYYNGNSLDEKFLLNICQRKEDDVLLYELIEDPNNKDEYRFIKSKKILKVENENLVKVDPSNYVTIFQKVSALNRYILNDLIVLIKSDIEEIIKYFDNNIKVPTFFYFSFGESKYESLRNHFIGLFIKFFVINLNPIKFHLKDNKIEIVIMEPKIYKDNLVNELLDILYSTPQNDLVYKNKIITNLKFENESLKKVILLDYFLKVSFMDRNREYFVPKLSKDENENKNIDKKLDLIELFNYENTINDKKNIFYYINKLQLGILKHKNKDNSIIDRALKFSKHIEYYQKLTKTDRQNEINLINKKTSIKFMIFFGENLNLHFGQFVDKKIDYSNKKCHGNELDLVYKEKYEKYYKSILDEAEIFYDLYITQIIPIENKEELAALAIGLYVSIYIINLLGELEPQNEYNDILFLIIKKKKEKLYKLFEKTKGFYGKFDFLITLLFQIVFYHQSNEDYSKYTNSILKKLEEENILPPIIIILMHNDNISLDFNKIKMYKEKKEINNNNYEPIKETLIYNIERNYHAHNYDIMNGINNNYLCENEECSDILSFSIQKSENEDKMYNMVINPKYLIIKLLKKITDNNSLFIHTYNDKNDIYEIAMLDELYFKIGFFQIPKEQKDSFNIL